MPKREIFFILLICHLLGDFFLQSPKLAEEKKTSLRKQLLHIGLYAIPFGVCFLALALWTVEFSPLGWGILLCPVVHGGIDLAKFSLSKTWFAVPAKPWREAAAYCVDQILHGLTLFAVPFLFSAPLIPLPETPGKLVPLVLFVLLLLKPANVTMQRLFVQFKEDPDRQGQGRLGAGALIGNLERLLMGAFLLLGEYSALGLTIAAKSIVRYDKISKDQAFSEYYIIGTMFSLLYTLAAYGAVFCLYSYLFKAC